MHNPVCGKFGETFYPYPDAKAFEWVETALEKAYGMFWTDLYHQYMVVEFLIWASSFSGFLYGATTHVCNYQVHALMSHIYDYMV